jgi:hypothetical protein
MSARKSGRTGRARHRAVRNARKARPVPRKRPPLDLALWFRIGRILDETEPLPPGTYRIHPEDLR